MLECLLLVATGWSLTAAADTVAKEQIAADEAILHGAGVKADNASLLVFFKKRTLQNSEADIVRKLIRQLGSDSYRLREQAMTELSGRGPKVLGLLQVAAKDDNLEISRRAEKCLLRIQEKDVPPEVAPAATRLLAIRKPAGTVEVLLGYLPFTDSDTAVEEARTLLATLAKEDTKARPILIAGLTDALPVRRAAAGEALCHAGLTEHTRAARKLLADPEPLVRMRVAVALIVAKEKDAVPVLIDTLPGLTMVQATQAEDVLLRLAEGSSPPDVALGNDELARNKCRVAWQAWWKEHAAKIDLARLLIKPQLLGYTLLVLLDVPRIMELGAENQVRWQFDNVIFPLDVQVLSGERVLVAEYLASRVTERNLKGDILWEKRIVGPLVAQRLANGNTFIATDSQVLEIDRAGKELYSISKAEGERIMKAVKLPNGEIACLTDGPRVVRMDTTGKEIYSYPVALTERYFGGRIYMLPNGRVLIPHKGENKVIEYDARGRAVWDVTVEQPVAAVRLPNGNTLVTSYAPQRGVVEFDRNGQEVWSYRSTSKVTRALRR